MTSALSMPGIATSSSCACSFIVSRTGQAGVVRTMRTATFDPQMLISPSGTKPRLTMSRCRSGSYLPESRKHRLFVDLSVSLFSHSLLPSRLDLAATVIFHDKSATMRPFADELRTFSSFPSRRPSSERCQSHTSW